MESVFRQTRNPTPIRSARGLARRPICKRRRKIAEAKRRNDLPMDSALGNPGWERSAADGHLDAPDEDDD
jgi:hypothetical protein